MEMNFGGAIFLNFERLIKLICIFHLLEFFNVMAVFAIQGIEDNRFVSASFDLCLCIEFDAMLLKASGEMNS